MILALGPMAGYTDAPFRDIVSKFGANYTISEMVSAIGLVYANVNSEPYTHLLACGKNENNLHAQLFGSKPEYMAEAAKIVSDMGVFSGININMGCPVKKIVSNGEGSALMNNTMLASKIVQSIKKVTNLPVSVKMRIGWDKEHINAVDFAKSMEDSGASLIIVHGRTREQMYSGNADWKIIADVKNSIKIPLIANGDIVDEKTAKDIISITGADGIMIARACIGNPWIFDRISSILYNKEYIEPTSLEKKSLVLDHIAAIIDFYGDQKASKLIRSQIAHYLNKKYRIKLYNTSNWASIYNIINNYFEEI